MRCAISLIKQHVNMPSVLPKLRVLPLTQRLSSVEEKVVQF